MRYIIYMPCQLACMLLCYLTNWFVVLFANEEGELPGVLRLWQTWDDTLDNKTDIGRMPSFLQYDWDAHYIQHVLPEQGRTRYTEELVNPFGLADRIRRYCCRVHWLYRNCAYGFAFYLFGATVWPQQYPIQTKSGDGWYFCRSGLVWAYKNETRITGRWYWKIYLGWKLQRTMLTDYQAMIATRLWISRKQQRLRGRPPGALFFLQKSAREILASDFSAVFGMVLIRFTAEKYFCKAHLTTKSYGGKLIIVKCALQKGGIK